LACTLNGQDDTLTRRMRVNQAEEEITKRGIRTTIRENAVHTFGDGITAH